MTDNNKITHYYSFGRRESNNTSPTKIDSLPAPVKEVLDSIIDIVMKLIEYENEFAKLFYETYEYIWVILDKKIKLSEIPCSKLDEKYIHLSFESAEKNAEYVKQQQLVNIYQCKSSSVNRFQIIKRFLQSAELTNELISISQKINIFQKLIFEKKNIYIQLLREHNKFVWINDRYETMLHSSFSNAEKSVSSGGNVIQQRIASPITMADSLQLININGVHYITHAEFSLIM